MNQDTFDRRRRSTYVLHFASPASPVDYDANPIQTLKVGTLGTHNCSAWRAAKEARFLLASTSEVYGDPLVHPQPETYWGNVNPIGPARLLRRGQALRRGVDDGLPPRPRRRHAHRPHLQHLRPADAGSTTGGSVPNFISQALAGEPLTVYGDGSQTRSLCYVVRPGPRRARRARAGRRPMPVNLGNPHEVTVLELAEMIVRLDRLQERGRSPRLPVDDPKQRRAGHHAGAPCWAGSPRSARGRPEPDPRILPVGGMTTSGAADLKQYVRDVPGYPQAGVIFRDITPLLADQDAFQDAVT